MKPHIHQLDPQRDLRFIEQEREDPVTGEFLQAGDRIVICAGCQSAFLVETWDYLGRKHCQQQRTLPALPAVRDLKLKRNKKRFVIGTHALESPPPWRRIVALVLDCFIAMIASIFLFLPMAGIYFWFRDGLDNGRSIGKTWMRLQTVDATTGQPCTWKQSFKRNFLPGLLLSYGHILIYGLMIGGNMLSSFLVVIGVIVFILTGLFSLVRLVSIFTYNEQSVALKTRVVRAYR